MRAFDRAPPEPPLTPRGVFLDWMEEHQDEIGWGDVPFLRDDAWFQWLRDSETLRRIAEDSCSVVYSRTGATDGVWYQSVDWTKQIAWSKRVSGHSRFKEPSEFCTLCESLGLSPVLMSLLVADSAPFVSGGIESSVIGARGQSFRWVPTKVDFVLVTGMLHHAVLWQPPGTLDVDGANRVMRAAMRYQAAVDSHRVGFPGVPVEGPTILGAAWTVIQSGIEAPAFGWHAVSIQNWEPERDDAPILPDLRVEELAKGFWRHRDERRGWKSPPRWGEAPW